MSQQLPLLVQEKIYDYVTIIRINKELDEMHEQAMELYQSMQNNGHHMSKCNGYDYVNGIKKYCRCATFSDTGDIATIMGQKVYDCDNCLSAKSCYCNDHAPKNLYDTYRGFILCKECLPTYQFAEGDGYQEWIDTPPIK